MAKRKARHTNSSPTDWALSEVARLREDPVIAQAHAAGRDCGAYDSARGDFDDTPAHGIDTPEAQDAYRKGYRETNPGSQQTSPGDPS